MAVDVDAGEDLAEAIARAGHRAANMSEEEIRNRIRQLEARLPIRERP